MTPYLKKKKIINVIGAEVSFGRTILLTADILLHLVSLLGLLTGIKRIIKWDKNKVTIFEIVSIWQEHWILFLWYTKDSRIWTFLAFYFLGPCFWVLLSGALLLHPSGQVYITIRLIWILLYPNTLWNLKVFLINAILYSL